MKKFVSGVIVGVFLFVGASVFADSVSLIGQKVQGLFAIEKGGTKIGDAVIINGTAFAPVRAISEATGATLSIEGKKIIMSGRNVVVSDTKEATSDKYQSKEHLEFKIRVAESEIESAQGAIKGLEDSVESANKLPSEKQRSETLTKIYEMIKVKKQVISEKEKELADLQEQLTEVVAQEAEEVK